METSEKRNRFQEVINLWEGLSRESVKRQEIETRHEYQPRQPDLIKSAVARFRQMQKLEDMVEQILDFLYASPENETEPVWVVEIKGKLVLVDGHHRLEAYSRASRQTVPAKVYRGRSAVEVARFSSRLANVRGSRIQLHPDEIREAVWQTLGDLSAKGQRTWGEVQADGYSYRVLHKHFGGQPAVGTVSNMVQHLRRVRDEYLPKEGEKDWPSWKKYLRWLHNERQGEDHEIEEEEHNVQKLADQLARKLEKYPSEVRRLAYQKTEELLGEVEIADMKAMGVCPED